MANVFSRLNPFAKTPEKAPQPTRKKSRVTPTNRAFDAGTNGRRMGEAKNGISSINAELRGDLVKMRERARKVARNNPYGASGVNAYVANLVGTGIRPRWNIEDKALQEEIQSLFQLWTLESDSDGVSSFYGQQALIARTQFESGECLVRFRTKYLADAMSVPLQLQLVDPDQLRHDLTISLSDSRAIDMGVEVTKQGKRLAYHLYEKHPGDPAFSALTAVTKRIPARDICHVFRQITPGQLRGIPELTPILTRLYDLDEYEDAEILRKKCAAMFAAFVKRMPDEDGNYGGEEFEEDEDGNLLVGIEPGAIHYLAEGEEVDFSSPADVGAQYGAWLKAQLQAVAVGMGLTYEQLTGDLSSVNYSSIRAGMVEFRRRMEMLQQSLMIYQFCFPVLVRWMDTAVVSGVLNIPDYFENRAKYLNVRWIAPAWFEADPKKAADADKAELEMGLSSRTELAARRGKDIEELDEEIANERKKADESGMEFESDGKPKQQQTENPTNENVVQDASKPEE